jgi:hypothetical protein
MIPTIIRTHTAIRRMDIGAGIIEVDTAADTIGAAEITGVAAVTAAAVASGAVAVVTVAVAGGTAAAGAGKQSAKVVD